MILRNILTQSFQSLGSNRLRSALTMLGVVWGTASVVFLLGWGQGFVKVMRAESRTSGDGFVIIWAKQARSEISGRKGARQLSFQLKDVDSILAHCPSVRYATPVNGHHGLLKAANNLKAGDVYGVNPDASHIFNLKIQRGRFLHPDDLKTQRRVIVLGADLADGLFAPGSEVLGGHVRVRGATFEVIGVLERKGDTLVDWGGRDDDKGYMPITTFQKDISGWRYVSGIFVQPRDPSKSEACIEEVRPALAKELDFSPDDKEALEIVDLSSILTSLDTMALMAAVFVTIIGVITLLVGGVGVMNIMLISVTERTREIGIRKAIGANRRHILLQFLVEALTITIASGLLGILLGCAVSIAFAAVPRPKLLAAPEISAVTLIGSFLVMVLTGLFAGVLPARRAASLEPVESLRYE